MLKPKCAVGRIQTDKNQTDRLHMDRLETDRCDSVELDGALRLCIKARYPSSDTAGDHKTKHLQDSQVAEVTPVDLQIRIFTLERQKHELLYINNHWAEQYRAMRQHYEQKVTDMRKMLIESRRRQEEREKGEEEEIRRREEEKEKTLRDRDTMESVQRRNSELSAALQEAEREAERLRAQNHALTRRGHQHHEKITQALREVQQSPAYPEEESQAKEGIWRLQAQVFKEDFLTERQDRERLQERHTELERRFRKVHTELHVLRKQDSLWRSLLKGSSESPGSKTKV